MPHHPDTVTVYLDQYRGTILGIHDGMTFATAVHEFHTDLLAGDRGASSFTFAKSC